MALMVQYLPMAKLVVEKHILCPAEDLCGRIEELFREHLPRFSSLLKKDNTRFNTSYMQVILRFITNAGTTYLIESTQTLKLKSGTKSLFSKISSNVFI